MESQFREHLSTWREATSDSANTFASRVSSWRPFQNGLRLPLTEQEADEVQEPSWFTLSRWDRLLIFGVCFLGAVACFALCIALLPVLALKPRKFAVLWSLGSLLFVISFGALQGPMAYIVHLVSAERLPFTLAFFGSIILTLVFSIGYKMLIPTLFFMIIQILATIWYTVSYFPMGAQSLKFASRVGARQVTSWINS